MHDIVDLGVMLARMTPQPRPSWKNDILCKFYGTCSLVYKKSNSNFLGLFSQASSTLEHTHAWYGRVAEDTEPRRGMASRAMTLLPLDPAAIIKIKRAVCCISDLKRKEKKRKIIRTGSCWTVNHGRSGLQSGRGWIKSVPSKWQNMGLLSCLHPLPPWPGPLWRSSWVSAFLFWDELVHLYRLNYFRKVSISLRLDQVLHIKLVLLHFMFIWFEEAQWFDAFHPPDQILCIQIYKVAIQTIKIVVQNIANLVNHIVHINSRCAS
jgi:hypothetical protein